MSRMFSLGIGLALVAGLQAAAPARAAEAVQAPAPLAVIGFELVDEQPDPARDEAMKRRLSAIHGQLAHALSTHGLYKVVDTGPAQSLIDTARERNAFLYRCNGCLSEIGLRLGTRLVLVGWVQRVSELILNINVSVRDAATDTEVLAKSVDLRGNNDQSFERGINFMVRDWVERRASNPGYGL